MRLQLDGRKCKVDLLVGAWERRWKETGDGKKKPVSRLTFGISRSTPDSAAKLKKGWKRNRGKIKGKKVCEAKWSC